jgi:hypothetical protein
VVEIVPFRVRLHSVVESWISDNPPSESVVNYYDRFKKERGEYFNFNNLVRESEYDVDDDGCWMSIVVI